MFWFFYQKVPKGSSLGTSWVDSIGGLKAFLWHLSVLHLLVSGTTWRGEGSAVGRRLQNTLSEWTDEQNICLLHTNATDKYGRIFSFSYSQNWGFSKTCKDVMLPWLSFVNEVNAIHASQLACDSTETSFSVRNHCDSGAEPKGKVLDLPVNLRSCLTYGHELWEVTERMRSRIQAVEMSSSIRWLCSALEIGWWAQTSRGKGANRVVQASNQDASCLPLEVL